MTKGQIRDNIYVHSFMVKGGLRNSVLLVYAFLYAYTLGPRGLYYGSKDYMAAALGVTPRCIYKALAKLKADGWITDYSDGVYSGLRCLVFEREENTSAAISGKDDKFATDASAEEAPGAEAPTNTADRAPIPEVANSAAVEAPVQAPANSAADPRAKSGRISPALKELFRDEPDDDDELPLYIRIMDEVRDKPIYNTIDLGHRSESVHLSERQYRELLRLVSPEQLTLYLRKLQLMLDRNLNTLRPSPHNHYKLLRKWITMDLGT